MIDGGVIKAKKRVETEIYEKVLLIQLAEQRQAIQQKIIDELQNEVDRLTIGGKIK